MLEFRLKDKRKNRFYSWWVILLLIVLCVLLARASYSVFWKKIESEKNLTKARDEYESLRLKNEKITDSMVRLETQSGVEEEIYSKFNVTKDGQKIAVIVDNKTASTLNSVSEQSISFFGKILNFFGW